MRSASAAVTGKPGMTAKAAAVAAAVTGKSSVTAIPAMIGKPAPVRSTIGNSAIPKSTVHIAAIDDTTSPISGPAPTAAIVSLAEPTIVKTTAIKISGIPSFEKWPIVGIIIVIPVVTVPGRIVIISISREFVFIPYRAGSVGISIWILVNGRRRRIYRPHRDGKANMRIHVYLRVALDGNQAGPYDSRKCK
jgi:hypothetical protein